MRSRQLKIGLSRRAGTGAVLLLAALGMAACTEATPEPAVVIYASVDQHFAEPILQAFAAESGIHILPVYDVEASKTTGLVNRLIAEKSRPRADVFWNGEFVQTLQLKEEGVLAPYHSAEAASIPAAYRDPADTWTGFAGRARVLLVNTDRVAEADRPHSIFDLESERWPADQIGIALPFFGTTATQAAALYAQLGPERARRFYQTIQRRGVQILEGNSTVRDQVADGRLLFGLTDTDDACGAMERGAPVAVVLPDQDSFGTLVIPNTVALIAGGPHPREARSLIDFLLKPATERRLVEMGWSHVPLRALDTPTKCFPLSGVRGMQIPLATLNHALTRSRSELREIFVR